MRVERHCAVCGSNSKRALFSQQFRGLDGGDLLDGYEVVVCKQCGACFADQIPSQDAFDQYYRNMSKYERQGFSGGMNEYDRHRLPISAKLIKQYVSDPNARILDVGCSTGGLLYVLKQQGFQDVVGLDPSAACAEVARDLYGVRVITGALADLSSEHGTFDLIILSSVLEHICDLGTALATLSGLLSEQGQLYLEVPDVSSFAATPTAPFQEFSIEHINYFSKATLVNLLQAHYFQLVFAQQDAVEPSPGFIAYEIKAMFQKCAEVSARATRDATSETALVDYITKSRQIERHIHEAIDNLVDGGSPIVVWGVGTHTRRLLATSRLAQAKIAAFVDSNPHYQGNLLNGAPVIGPVDLKGMPYPILISSRAFQKEIETEIRDELGLSNLVVTLYEV